MAALNSAEQQRSTEAIKLAQGYTRTALQLTAQQGPAVRAKLIQLTQLLLRLLDGFVLPADLVGSGEDLAAALMRGQSGRCVTLGPTVSADTSRYFMMLSAQPQSIIYILL